MSLEYAFNLVQELPSPPQGKTATARGNPKQMPLSDAEPGSTGGDAGQTGANDVCEQSGELRAENFFDDAKPKSADLQSVASDDLGHARHAEAARRASRANLRLNAAVDKFLSWKDALVQVYPLPSNVLLPLLIVASELLRSRNNLHHAIGTL